MAVTDKVLYFASEDDALVVSLMPDQRCVQGFTVALFHRKRICLILSSTLHPLDEQSDDNIKRKVVQ